MPEFPFFPSSFLRPNPPFLNGKLPNAVDPWAKRELWRSHPFFSTRNRILGLFPGLGIATVAFVFYVAYDKWYHISGPGMESRLYWEKWMEERKQRDHQQSSQEHH